MKNLLVAAVIVLILLFAQTLTVGVYESDEDTYGWEWYHSETKTHIVIGFNQEQWVNALENLDHGFRYYYHFNEEEEIPILVYLGECPSDGYAVDISRIIKENEKTIITITRKSPKPGSHVNQEPTHPHDFLLLRRTQLINDQIIVQDQYGNVLVQYHDTFPGEERVYEEIVIIQSH